MPRHGIINEYMYTLKKLARGLGWIFLILMASVSIGIGGATPVPILARKEDLYPEEKIEQLDLETQKDQKNDETLKLKEVEIVEFNKGNGT